MLLLSDKSVFFAVAKMVSIVLKIDILKNLYVLKKIVSLCLQI